MINDIFTAKIRGANLFFQKNQQIPPKAHKENTLSLSGEHLLLTFIKKHKYEKIKKKVY